MKRFSAWVGIVVIWLLTVLPTGAAETSQTIAFSGCDGTLTGTVDLRFRLFTASAAGMMVFEETQTGIDASSTCFSVRIGDATAGGLPPALFAGNPSLWIAFALNSDPDTELGGGRTPITANGYAFRTNQAISADQLGGVPASGYVQTTGGSLSGSSDTPVVSVTNTGNGSALTAASQSAQGVAGLFQNSAGGDLLRGQGSDAATVFRLFNNGGGFFSGNVGIGTAAPGEKLVVQTATANYGFVHTDGDVMVGSWVGAGSAGTNGGWFGTKSNHPLRFFTNSSSASMTIATNGNVGIGTNSPFGKLQVNGTGFFTGDTTVPFGAGSGVVIGQTLAWGYLMSYDYNMSNGKTLAINPFGGNVGIGTTTPSQKLDVNGTVKAKVVQITGADFSEKFEVRNTQNKIEPGRVVAIDPDNPGKLVVSAKAYDRRVAGIISGAGGINTGMLMGQPGTMADGDHPVALSGRVYVWADASNGAIVPGDLLTTSNTPGHAMRVTNYNKAQGATLGKAMTGLAKGRGLVLVLVTLQ